MRVCSTEYVYHALLNPEFDLIESITTQGLRPLSDFPESERWQQIQKQMPGFFEGLYEMIARPVLKRPYENSGVFVSPIDFQQMPGSFMNQKTRVRIPVSRIDPDYAVLTYVLNDERIVLPLNAENLEQTAEIWTAEMVTRWFAADQSKIFFYVPQIAVYQPKGISVSASDVEGFILKKE